MKFSKPFLFLFIFIFLASSAAYAVTIGEFQGSGVEVALVPEVFVPAVCFAYDNVGGISITTEITINLDTTTVCDSAYTLANDVLTFNEAGVYDITAWAGTDDTDTAGGSRTHIEFELETNVTGSWVDIDGTKTEIYHRETEESSGSTAMIKEMVVGEGIRLRATRIGGSSPNIETEADAGKLKVVKIR